MFITCVGLAMEGDFEMANINMKNADYINVPSDLGGNMVCPYLCISKVCESSNDFPLLLTSG